jgi:lysozyme
MLSISQDGIDLIKHFEQLSLNAYLCPAGVPTIGWGHTGKDVKLGSRVTVKEAEELLRLDIADFEEDVNNLVKVPLTQNQFDALVSFAFNCGSDIDADNIAEGLGDSTLLKKLNGKDYVGAASEFIKWVRAGGRVLAGLVRRRKAEHSLFSGDPKWRVHLWA